jgi:ABC-type Na+ efflux pump permease subunit
MMNRPPRELSMMWLIAWRAALESLRDRMSLVMGFGFVLGVAPSLLILGVRPLANPPQPLSDAEISSALAFYMLIVGLAPSASAIGVAAGQFAGEKERGILTPLLASPASNTAIFFGKVIGAILPACLYSILSQIVFVLGVAFVLGPSELARLPLLLAVGMLLLVPAGTCFAAVIASLISSRVRTYNSAQQLAGLILMPAWALIFSIAFRLQEMGAAGVLLAIAALGALDIVLATIAARTWRREEVLSQR